MVKKALSGLQTSRSAFIVSQCSVVVLTGSPSDIVLLTVEKFKMVC